jgi:KaiC/GvpD/RAD55 family RecA-like ATPase
MGVQAAGRMPTGISSLDPVLDGGIPPGSVVLLEGDIGAGSHEFVYSSLIYLSMLRQRHDAGPNVRVPDTINYVTFTRLKEDVLKLLYVTLSLANPKKGKKGEGSTLVVLDSLTDLATQFPEPERWKELTAFLRGLQRVTKVWNSTVYLLLTKGVLEPSREKEIADCVDAVVLFKWEETVGQRRQRTMFFEKFRGVMPHLEERDLVKFVVRITPGSGFEVSNIRVVV